MEPPRFSGLMFASPFAFQSHLIQSIFKVKTLHNYYRTDCIYTNIEPSWAESAVDVLEQRKIVHFKSYNPSVRTFQVRSMMTPLHNVDQEWLVCLERTWLTKGIISWIEKDLLTVTSYPRFKFTEGPFVGMENSPSMAIQLAGDSLPRVIFETGFLEHRESLFKDVTDWLTGGNGAIKLVVLVHWDLSAVKCLEGYVELYGLDRNMMPRRLQREQIFPVPPEFPGRQTIRITRKMLFGNMNPLGRNPNDILHLDIRVLRNVAVGPMARMGYLPA